MHHCVATYKFACERGCISIWSLTSEFPVGHINRGVTVELTKDGRIVQCRGFASRLPDGNKATMVAVLKRPVGVAGAVSRKPAIALPVIAASGSKCYMGTHINQSI